MRNLLASRRGRQAAFFLLYVTEGIPQGFTSVAIATQMRRQGLSPAAIGVFVGSLYLPWAWKWLAGPVVDLVYSERLGRRRAWIVACQVLMAATVLMLLPIDYTERLKWFIGLVLVHNVFAALQDVAIDALACETLPAHERGMANGMMFAGAYCGNALGGSGVLLLTGSFAAFSFDWAYPLIALGILAVTVGVSLRLRETAGAGGTAGGGAAELPPAQPLVEPLEELPRPAVLARIRNYVSTVWVAFVGTRSALFALLFALLPSGAYGLSLALQANLAVELGLTDSQIGWLGLGSTILAATGCIIGGWTSDRLGRRLSLTLFILSTAVPTLALAAAMQTAGRIEPLTKEQLEAGTIVVSAGLLATFWATTLTFNLLQGLMYGVRTAFFMDVCNPRIAATQFTAYMAVLNLTIAYSAWWQGWAIETWGYPLTLATDAALGCLGLLMLWNVRAGRRGA